MLLFAQESSDGLTDLLAARDGFAARLVLVGLLALSVASVVVWWIFLGRKRLIQDMPTSAVKGVALGLNELVGVAEAREVVSSPHAHVDCVWWKNVFYREDNEGGWRKTGEKTGGPLAFDLVDETGRIPVRARHADVQAPKVYEGPYVEDLHAGDPNPTLVTRYLASQGNTARKKVVEHALAHGDPVYVLGTAQLPLDDLEVYIGADTDGGEPFLVRTGGEADALFIERVGTVVGAVVALLAAAGAGIAWYDGDAIAAGTIGWSEINLAAPAVFVATCVAVMASASLVFAYNGLVRLRHRVLAAWGLIDVQLRRRHDLFPNLVRVVDAHAAHERSVQTAVAQLRSSLAADLPTEPSDDVLPGVDRGIRAETLALDRLLAVIEAYPAITADASFGALRAELVDTEDRVALARSFYNTSVLALHDRARVFPGNLIAWVFELDLDASFIDDLGGAAVPTVGERSQPQPGAQPSAPG